MRMSRGTPTGSAMPLCWAHAEYLTLVRSRRDGDVFDCPPPVRERYAISRTGSRVEIWTLAHQPPRIRSGKLLRIITSSPATVHWNPDGRNFHDSETRVSGLSCHYADLDTAKLPPGSHVQFTFRWKEGWEGRDFSVEI